MPRIAPIAYCCVILFFTLGLSTAITLDDDRFQQLEKTVNGLEAKVSLLEALLKLKIEQHEILSAKVSRLDALELKAQQQEELLVALSNEKANSRAKSVTRNYEMVNQQATGNNLFYIRRTCGEIREDDPTLTSGWYWIDPDGPDSLGDDPIYVYCNMATGTTSIPHDSEGNKTDVGHSPSTPGDYFKVITYNATMRQMAALAEISERCDQFFRYDCIDAPFEIDGVAYSWWNDRNGVERYFWSGDYTSTHTCQCGKENQCTSPSFKCNCDSRSSTALVDTGYITEKNMLPITRLNFGGVTYSGEYTLGRFECAGQVLVGMPKSCAELWRLGHTLSGLYSVMGTKFVETVYCDFTKLPNDPGIQKWIGNVDVKSLSVYFYVQRSSDMWATTTVTYDVERLNVGGAMNTRSGKFTAPRSGTYFFSFTAIASFRATKTDDALITVSLKLNNNNIGSGKSSSEDKNTGTYSIQSTLSLSAGDQIWVAITYRDKSGLQDDGAHYTHFTGWLLEENISQSLS